MARGDTGARVALGTFEAAFAAGVEPWQRSPAEEFPLGDDLVAFHRLERRRMRWRFAALDRAALGEPLLEAAIEDRDLLGAKVTEHEPAACRGARRAIVVDDDAVVSADAQPFHAAPELGGTRQHVRRGVRA